MSGLYFALGWTSANLLSSLILGHSRDAKFISAIAFIIAVLSFIFLKV